MKLQWLKISDSIAPCPCCKIGGSKKAFFEKTILGITSFFKDGIFSEAYAKKDGLLQRIDPRVKIISMALILIAISFLRHLSLIVALYILVLMLVASSKIPLRFFLLRVWLFVPFFSGIIAIPALFNIFVPGEPLLTIMKFSGEWSLGPLKIPASISITKQGVLTVSLFIMRVATSVSFVVLLVLTTRWAHLLKALSVLRIPQMFTFTISMTYRYIHLLLKLIEDIHTAKKSRFIKKTSVSAAQRWVTSQMGVVLKRSLKMSEDVYSAMISRGVKNEVRVLDTFRIKKLDYLWTGFSLLLIFIIMGLNSIWG